MKIETVRKIDYWVGIPACFLLSILNRVGQKLFPKKDPVRPLKKFLLIELSEMGSAILAYPALKDIQKAYPGAELYFMIFEKNRASVDILNLVPPENVLTIREKSLGSFLADVVKIVVRVHRERIDVVFDLELFTRVTAILTFMSGAPVRVGFHKFRMEGLYRGNLHTHKIQYNFQQHIGKSFLSFTDVLRYPVKNWPTMDETIPDSRLETAAYRPSEAGENRIREKIKKRFPGFSLSSSIILLNPSAGEIPIRAWPLENYLELAQRLLANPNRIVVLMGAGADRETTGRLAAALSEPRCVDLTGETTFEELMDLFCVAEALVTNDSGPAHFASLTPIKNFVFLGPESPYLYGPLGGNTHVFYSHFPCSPCLTAFNHRHTSCKDNRCLQVISVEEVWETIQQSLSADK
ncbi:MAG: glycosyltransferase family 9 protein [Deltaproteobacteria bacterium]|nr:glycosyltransferase family 9 protein [Deltaproteobacteria bacterium]